MNLITAFLIIAIDTSIVYINPSEKQVTNLSFQELMIGPQKDTEVVYVNPSYKKQNEIAFGEMIIPREARGYGNENNDNSPATLLIDSILRNKGQSK